jgi:ABC-type transport system involved in multi-copper enzyme maturation permease subunit
MVGMRRTMGGIGAVGVKELRGRMRGRRAFVILTIYLVLLGGFAWMVELISERSFSSGFGGSGSFATAAIGQAIFAALLMLETLQVAFLAPAATAGSVSLEREKQTLELLIVTPISALAIVVGKLFSALIYVWLLIAASIPLTAVVFVYGGVAPEDIFRGYVVLVVTALGLGSFALFASSLVRRTQAATAISVFAVLFVSIGTVFLLIFWMAMASADDGRGTGPIKGQAPEVIAYLNPFIAQADVLCGTDTGSSGWCGVTSSIVPNQPGVLFNGGNPAGGQLRVIGGVGKAVPVAIDANGNPVPFGVDSNGNPVQIIAPDAPGVDVAPFAAARELLWPKSVLLWLLLSVAFILLSVQFVSPTRRWHLRRGRRDPGQAPA